MHLPINLLVVGEPFIILINRYLEQLDVLVDLSDNSLDVLSLLHLLLELFVCFYHILVKFKELGNMLNVERVVLGPGKQGGVGLACFVVCLGGISESFLHITQCFLVLIGYLAVTLERNLEGTDHGLNAMRVGLDGLKNFILCRIHLV